MTEKKAFFTTLPGILTGLAALITATGGLIYALNETGLIGSRAEQQVLVEDQDPSQPRLEPLDETRAETTDGWAIIGKVKSGRFSDLALMVHEDSPAPGRSYDVVDDFRLIANDPREHERGEQVITLGRVRRGDRVELLELYVPTPSTQRVNVYAKLRAVLRGVRR